jgi:hypothetical protein
MKKCSRCQIEKPVEDFTRDKNRKDERYPQCKSCVNEYTRARRERPEVKEHERQLRQRPEAKAKQHAYNVAYVQRMKEQRRASYRRHRYGVDDATLKALLKEQGDSCGNAGCLIPLTLAEAHVDHDKTCCPGRSACGKCIRGLLCPGCNVGVGFFRDDPKKLRGMAEYVERKRE